MSAWMSFSILLDKERIRMGKLSWSYMLLLKSIILMHSQLDVS